MALKEETITINILLFIAQDMRHTIHRYYIIIIEIQL